MLAVMAVAFLLALEFRDLAEQAASEPLAPEIEAALQSEHDLRIGKALAQARYAQEAADRAYENATKEADNSPATALRQTRQVFRRCRARKATCG